MDTKLNQFKETFAVCTIAALVTAVLLAATPAAQAVDPPEYGYWDGALHSRYFDHVSFHTVNPSSREIERALQSGRKVVIHAFQIYGSNDVIDNIQKVRDVIDQMGSRLDGKLLYVSIAHEQHGNIAYWENIISQARSILGPGVKLAMNFGGVPSEGVPAGLDVYDFQFYGTGYETSQAQLDSNADAFFNNARAKVLAANGEARDIMVTGRGWKPAGQPDLNPLYPSYLVDWVKRQSDVIGINWWLYAMSGEGTLRGVLDMPAFADGVRNEGLALGYGFTPLRNLLDNSDLELDRTKTAGNLVPNFSFENPSSDPNYPIDWWFANDPNIYYPDPLYVTDGSNALDGTDSLYYSWHKDGPPQIQTQSTSIRIPLSGEASYRFKVHFKRDPNDLGNVARMRFYTRWAAYGKEMALDGVTVDHASNDWEAEVLTVEAPYQADSAVLQLTTGHFEIATPADPDAKGWWDQIECYTLVPAEPTRNLLTNTSFERGLSWPEDWGQDQSSNPPSVYDTTGANAWDGTDSIYFEWDEYVNPVHYENAVNYHTWFLIEPGQTYTISGYWKNDVNHPNYQGVGYMGFQVSFYEYNSSGQYVGGAGDYLWDHAVYGGGWQRLADTVTAPLPSDPNGFIRCQVRLVTTAWQHRVDGKGQTAGWWDAIQFEKVTQPVNKNMVKNPGFERDETAPLDYPDNWSQPGNPPTYDTSGNNAWQGTDSVYFVFDEYVDPPDYTDAIAPGWFEVDPNTEYTASFYWLNDANQPHYQGVGWMGFQVLFHEINPTGGYVQQLAEYVWDHAIWGEGWQRVVQPIPATPIPSDPNNIIKCEWRLITTAWMHRDPNGQGQTAGWWDAVQFEQGTTATDWEDHISGDLSDWVDGPYAAGLQEDAGTYPEYWTRAGNAPAYAEGVGQAHEGTDSILAAYVPEGLDAGGIQSTAPTTQGPIFLDGCARGSATDYTLSAYCKVADEDADGVARVNLRIRSVDWWITDDADVSQDFDISGAGWQRISLTANLPANSWYGYATLKAVDPNTGAGDSIVYLDSIQFEQASSASEYQKIPFSTIESDLNGDGAVNWQDFAVFAGQWLASGCSDPDWCDGADLNHSGNVDWADFAVFAGQWLETEPWFGY